MARAVDHTGFQQLRNLIVAKNAAVLTRDKFKAVLGGLKHLQSDVLVGVPAENGVRRDGEGMTNAALAYIHDNGSAAAHIPARPFMRPGIVEAQDKITGALKRGAQDALKGNANGVQRALNVAGLTAQSSIRAKINSGIEPELSPRTLAAREARGRKGTKPLIDTGQLRNSINYVVRKK